MNRVELACHTGYSRMKGIGLGQDWIMFAVQNNIDTIVVTDRGNVDAYVDLQDNIRSRKLDIKLIMGVDLSVYDDRNLSGTVTTSGRLSVLVRNEIGKKNLYKILSEGERKYKVDSREVQIPLSLLLNYKEELIIGSGTEDGNDAYPAFLVRIAECLYKGIGIDKNCDIAYELLQEAEEIYNIQIEKGNYYAKLCIDRVLRDLRELEELCSKNC